MTDEALTPTEWLTILVNRVSSIVLASDLDDWLHRITIGIDLDLSWLPVCLLVTEADLAIGVEAP